jgi:RNA polymerase sigma-70 factor, ECF subfamily
MVRAHSDPDRRRLEFERLFEAHFRSVTAYVVRRAAPGEVDDAVAETFLVAWRRGHDVPDNAKPWLFGVARRVLANQRRAAGRRAALAERVAGERFGAASSQVAESPVVAALSRLSERDREVLMLAAWEGLCSDETAAALGCSRAAAKVRLHRAKRRLRAALEQAARKQTMTLGWEECHEE